MSGKQHVIETPGAPPPAPEPELQAQAPAVAGQGTDDAQAARVSALELQIVQMNAMVQQLLAGGRADVQAEAPSKAVRLVGDDARPMTSTQLLEAIASGRVLRPTRTVMCADGYLAIGA